MLQSGVHSVGRNAQSNLPALARGKILQCRDNIIAIISTFATFVTEFAKWLSVCALALSPAL